MYTQETIQLAVYDMTLQQVSETYGPVQVCVPIDSALADPNVISPALVLPDNDVKNVFQPP